MEASTKLAAIFGIVGLTGIGLHGTAQAADRRAVQMLVSDAIKTGDMAAAMRKHGAAAKLTEAESKALSSLSQQDLQALKGIQDKLKNFASGDDTGGIIY
jgi:hypothetical protein